MVGNNIRIARRKLSSVRGHHHADEASQFEAKQFGAASRVEHWQIELLT